jgi:sortase A
MKKLKMWYIKLAFAALFFTLIFETHQEFSVNPQNEQSKNIQSVAEIQASSTEADSIAVIPEAPIQKASAQAQLVSFKGKLYPYTISIPAIKVNAGVLGMGVTSDGRMAVPNNYTEVGWYNLGTQPGTIGSAVMGAHVDNGGKINGVFKNLKTLKVGSSIYITDGAGNKYRYVVVDRKVYNYQTAITDNVFLPNDTERLNLITCYGTWLPKQNTYNQRLVVFAKLDTTTLASR